ncbi:MAG TPA: hypothetical protein VFP45_01790, partial [Candidatus Nitrosotalea sp.]|nr:hypothetical protein [Candidatus Nitrosotalea sp.]
MSEDLVSAIEELIKSERGDVGRLQDILAAIKNGNPVSFEDRQYIESLTQSQSPSDPVNSDNIITESKSENAFDNVIPESSPQVPTPQTSEKATKRMSP